MGTNDKGRLGNISKQASNLSLGLSMIVAVLTGLGIGYVLYKWLGYYWLIWVGLFYGVVAALLNVIKAYKRLKQELDELQQDEKYHYQELIDSKKSDDETRADTKL